MQLEWQEKVWERPHGRSMNYQEADITHLITLPVNKKHHWHNYQFLIQRWVKNYKVVMLVSKVFGSGTPEDWDWDTYDLEIQSGVGRYPIQEITPGLIEIIQADVIEALWPTQFFNPTTKEYYLVPRSRMRRGYLLDLWGYHFSRFTVAAQLLVDEQEVRISVSSPIREVIKTYGLSEWNAFDAELWAEEEKHLRPLIGEMVDQYIASHPKD